MVWIDGGLHASEVLGAQQLIETIYHLTSRQRSRDAAHPERRHHSVHAGQPRRHGAGRRTGTCASRTRRSGRPADIPRLYQKYIGHDNNRDFYMSNMQENAEHERVMYREWYPADHVQPSPDGPGGAVMFAPPFRDPFNYNFDPLIPAPSTWSARRCTAASSPKDKPGAVMRSGAPYSTWFNGGLRTTPTSTT